jgi:hypothetical protein
MSLESWYQVSQILLTVIAALAALAAFAQVRSAKRSEILRYLGTKEVKVAKRRVLRRIRNHEAILWSDEDSENKDQDAALTVCSCYDLLGQMLKGDWLDRMLGARRGLTALVGIQEQGYIEQSYEFLKDFRQEFPGTFSYFDWLYSRIKHSPIPVATPR